MHRAAARIDRPIIANEQRVDPVVVDIAVEQFGPAATPRKSKLIAKEGRVVETGHHDYVVALPIDPPMKCQHTVDIVGIEGIDRFAS